MASEGDVREPRTVVKVAVVLASAACLLAGEGVVFAQRGNARPTAVERRVEQLNRQAEQYERDRLSRDQRKGAARSDQRLQKQAAAARAAEDLENLQAGYNQIVLAMTSKNGLDYEKISGTVATVNKCASRLKISLALPRPESAKDDEVPGGPEPERMEESLAALSRHVHSFLTNPLFEAPVALDAVQAAKASRDLERIIALSEHIRKNGDKTKR